MKKRIILRLLALALVLAAALSLTACSTDKGQTPGQGTGARTLVRGTPLPLPIPMPGAIGVTDRAAAKAAAENVASTAPVELPATYAEYAFEHWNSLDWEAKTTKYYLGWIDGFSFGGMFNPNNEYGYVTSMAKVFLYLYEDGSLEGFYLNNTGSADVASCYDMEQRIDVRYLGYWEQNGQDVTIHFLSNRAEPGTVYTEQTFTIAAEGEPTYLDFDFLGIGAYMPYTLQLDGQGRCTNSQEGLREINAAIDEEIAG